MSNVFEKIKELVKFEDVAHHHGIEFNRSKKTLCPFHDDKNPSFSLHPSGAYAKCFSCDKTFDSIELEYLRGGHANKWEAAKALNVRHGLNLKFDGYDKERAQAFDDAFELLEWHSGQANKSLLQNEEALNWLEINKGITIEDVKEYKIGYVGSGFLRNKVTDKSKEIALKLGLLKEKDGKLYDAFWNRLIFPVWNSKRIVGVWTRQWPDKKGSYYKWLGLPSTEFIPNKPLAFVENVNCDICVVTESIPDTLAFLKVGIPACALLGTNPGEYVKESLSNAKAKLFFCMDNDEAGTTAAYSLAKEFRAYVINLGFNQDTDEILTKKGKDEFKTIAEKAIKEAKYFLDLVIEREDKIEALREISKLEYESDKDIWLNKLKNKHDVTIGSLKKDLVAITTAEENKLLDQAEKHSDRTPLNGYSEEEIKKANELLNSNNILGKVVSITNNAGYVKEERNKKLAYLACTSRKLPGKKKAISLITKGESSSGKSELVKHVLKLVPPGDVKEFTYITERALLHTRHDLSHQILCVFEREGGEASDYTLRTAISEERLSIFIPVKDPITGDFESIEKEIPAEGLVYIETTTQESTEPQNASRTFEFFTDSSPELTREVLRSQARTHIQNESKLESEYRVWRCLQDLLKPIPVYVPYAEELAEQFPADKVRARRDFLRLLALIEVSALLHQKNRERKEIDGETYIIANEQDFNIAYDIIRPILSQTYKELSPKEEVLIGILKDEYGIGYFSEPDSPDNSDSNTFSLKNLREKINDRLRDKDTYKTARNFKAYNTLRKYLKKLVSKDIVEWNGQQGIKSKYVLLGEVQDISFYISLGRMANTPKNEVKVNDLNELEQNTLATEEYGSSMANRANVGQNPEVSAIDETISHTLATVERGSSSPYKSLQNLDISPLATGNIRRKIQKVNYATGENVFKVEQLDGHGKPTINIITPECAEFEEVKNLYEQQQVD